ncbi:hypothetical protein AB6A40_006828 [Gnathostoma spinigerum]|uniref:Uncharacterized protein n=1 Tax=Gnathostoma spinigerum TaxID=75299 RepID=A0ABD6ES45_9BILA
MLTRTIVIIFLLAVLCQCIICWQNYGVHEKRVGYVSDHPIEEASKSRTKRVSLHMRMGRKRGKKMHFDGRRQFRKSVPNLQGKKKIGPNSQSKKRIGKMAG